MQAPTHIQRLERLNEIQAELDRALGLGFDESGQDLKPDENYQLPVDLEALLSCPSGGQQSAQAPAPSTELAQTQLDSVFELPSQQVSDEDLSSPAAAISHRDASSFLEATVSGGESEVLELRHESLQETLPTATPEVTELEKPLTESAPEASAVPASPTQTTVAPKPVPQTDIQLSLFASSPNVVPDASLPLVQSEAQPENLLAQTPAITHATADVVHERNQVNTIQQSILLQQSDASTLISLATWRRVAESLGKSHAYLNRIDTITAEFQTGQPLSPQAHTAQENDFKLYQTINHSLNKWSRVASALGKSDAYLAKIADVTAQFGNGYPSSTQAQTTMQKDFESYSKFQSLLSTWQRVAQTLGRSDNYLQRLAAVTQNLDSGEPLTVQAQLSMQKDFQTHGQLQKRLLDWQRVAVALGKTDAYVQRIAVVAGEFESGRPLSQPAKTALQQDFATYKELQSHLKQWYEVAQTIGKPAQYLNRIQKVASSFVDAQSPSPLSQKAMAAMHQDLYSYQQQTRSKSQINRDLVGVEI